MAKYIVDGNLYMYKNCCKNYSLVTTENLRTGGIYGFLRSLHKMVNIANCIVVFDHGHSKRRKSILPTYKDKSEKDVRSNGDKIEVEGDTEDDINLAETFNYTMQYLPVILNYLGIPNFSVPGKEADDVIYALSKYFQSKDEKCYLVSGDEDYVQGISDGVKVFDYSRDLLYTEDNFEDIYEFPFQFFTLYKSIIGDSSDNIDGLYRVGPATARKIIKGAFTDIDYKLDIEELFEILENWGKRGETKVQINVAENIDIIRRNYRLIDLEMVLEEEPEIYDESVKKMNEAVKLASDKKSFDKTQHWFKNWEFNSLQNWITWVKFGIK